MPAEFAGPNGFARELFDGLPDRYDRLAELLSFGQNGRWRAAMVGRAMPVDGGADGVVLDVASGTAGVALQLASRGAGKVVGVDLTEAMLREGRRRVAAAGREGTGPAGGGEGRAAAVSRRQLRRADVHLPVAVRAGPAGHAGRAGRVLKPGGVMASLEFCVPTGTCGGRPGGRTRGWRCRRRAWPSAGGSGAGRALPRAEHLGHYRRYPVDWTVRAWEQAGMTDVGARDHEPRRRPGDVGQACRP